MPLHATDVYPMHAVGEFHVIFLGDEQSVNRLLSKPYTVEWKLLGRRRTALGVMCFLVESRRSAAGGSTINGRSSDLGIGPSFTFSLHLRG
ncbi:unnamed protein product [Ectocarpus sp. CCAP 1310/34]|nr:unnamed protein product [Ectocarpus sp. CCAP 1310/34]